MSVAWEDLELAAPAEEGYAPNPRPFVELIAAALAGREERRPAIVWIRDDLDQKSFEAVEDCFSDEWVGLALRRFHCLRAATKSLPDARQERDLLRRAPILCFFDPAGRLVHTLEGRRARSRAAVELRVRKLWELSYSYELGQYLRRMDDILDRTGKLDRLRAALARKKDAAKDRPHRLAALRRKESEIEAEAKKIAEDERRIHAACLLRQKYRPAVEPAEKG